MIEGDRKIATTLDDVIKETHPTSCILVSDGAEDEFVVPIIQSRIPVASIRRVIVNQMPNLEGTYYILKKFFDDPKISRVVFVPLGLAMLLYAVAYILGYPGTATIIVIGVIGMYLLYKGFGLDEFIHSIINALQASMSRGKFSFVTYSTTIVLTVIGFTIGFFTVLNYYASDNSLGVLLYVMSFIYGAIFWLIIAGLVTSVGIIIDVYINERENLVKVIVFPFFVTAIGIILYGASAFILAISSVTGFPISAASGGTYIMYSTLFGLACAIAGVVIQFVIAKRQTEIQKESIIETI